jgi:hypothetical protein
MEGMFQPLLLSESQQTGKHIENGRSWLFRDAKPCNLAEGYQQRCHIPNYTALHSLHIHGNEVLMPRIWAVSGQVEFASLTKLQSYSDWQSSLHICGIWCRLSGPGLITIVKLVWALTGHIKQYWSKWQWPAWQRDQQRSRFNQCDDQKTKFASIFVYRDEMAEFWY